MLHQVAARIVHNHRMRHAVLRQLPRGQTGALIARTGLVHPDMQGNPRLKRRINRCQRRAPIHRRQPARVAVCQDIHRLGLVLITGANQRQPVPPDGLIDGHILLGDARGLQPSRFGTLAGGQRRQQGAHPLHRPAQIHRRGSGLCQHVASRRQRRIGGVVAHGQRHPISRRHPDQGGAAHLHGTDGVFRIAHVFKVQRDKLMRQARLVYDLHRIIGSGPDRAKRCSVNFHRKNPNSKTCGWSFSLKVL